MAHKSPKNSSHNKKEERSAAARWLLAIFTLLLVWFLIWLWDWIEELTGWRLKNKLKDVAASTNTATQSTIQAWNTIEYKPLQNILQQTIEDNGHIHRQAAPAEVWTVYFNWGKVPDVTTYDDNGLEIKGVVQPHIIQTWIEPDPEKGTAGYWQYTADYVTITFSEPVSGFAVFP